LLEQGLQLAFEHFDGGLVTEQRRIRPASTPALEHSVTPIARVPLRALFQSLLL
jgi:hypothetical protein